MTIIFDNESFETPMLEKLAEAYNKEGNQIIKVYMNSGGGRVSILKAIQHIINSDPERFMLIGFHHLSSCAFELYMKVNCKKELLKGTIGMYHLGKTSIDFNDKKKTVYGVDDAAMERQQKYHLPEIRKLMKDCEFTKAEISKIEKGGDLFIQYYRMKEMEQAYIKNNPKYLHSDIKVRS